MRRIKKYQNTSFFHGDLHYGNILINDNSEIRYVDPNGTTVGLLSYDYGKIMHSTIGHYNLIQDYKYVLIDNGNLHFTFYVDSISNHLIFSNKLNDILKNSLSKELYEQSLFAFFVHMVSLIPHHLDNKNKQALALYLQAIIIGEYAIEVFNK